MTQEEIHYNQRCAKFLGWDYSEERDRWNEDMLHQYSFVESIELKFHSDWNWIMEVIEKILDIALEIDSMEMYYNITDAIPDINATTLSINQFLIWHEQNK